MSLFKLFFILDIRSKDENNLKRLSVILFSYLLTNTLFSFSNYSVYDGFSYSFISFTTNLFLISFLAITEFGNLFFSKSHLDSISGLPLSDKVIFRAKFFSALIFIYAFSLVILTPQIVFYYLFGYSAVKVIAFAYLNILFSLFALGLIFLIYTAVIFISSDKANYLLYFMQFAFLFYIMYSTSFTSSKSAAQKTTFIDSQIISCFPQTYFVRAMENYYHIIILSIFTMVIFSVYYYVTKNNYRQLSAKIYSLPKSRIKIKRLKFLSDIAGFYNRIIQKFSRTPDELASYKLIRYQFKNSKSLKARYLPVFFLPVIIALIGVISGSDKLLFLSPEKQPLDPFYQIMSPSIIITIIIVIKIMFESIKIIEENSPDTVWLLKTLPFRNLRLIYSGLTNYLYFYFLIPIGITLFVLLAFKMKTTDLILNFIIIILTAKLFTGFLAVREKKLPFSIEYSKFNSAGRFLGIFLYIFIGLIFFLLQFLIFLNIFSVIISVIIFIFLNIFINIKLYKTYKHISV